MQIKDLFPDRLLISRPEASSQLEKSIAEHGILVPVVLCGGLVVDGHQRLVCAAKTGQSEVKTVEVAGKPEEMFLELNQHRAFLPAEIISLIKRLPGDADSTAQILKKAGLSPSPQLLRTVNYLAATASLSEEQINSLPFNICRELGHLQIEFETVLPWFLQLSATAAEKRLIAGLLRQADRRKALPKEFAPMTGAEAIAWLNEIVQPRRSQALKKLEPLLDSANLPGGIRVKFDPTFEKPGFEMNIQVGRNHLDRFARAQKLAEEIFARVEEL